MTDADELATEAHTIAQKLTAIDEKQGRNGALTGALLVQGVVNVIVLVVLIVLLIPVIKTARTVQEVAGPDAIAAQGVQQQGFVTFFLCSARENTSESRVMDGKQPLPLRSGCPPYNFAPDAPIVPTTTTTTARSRKVEKGAPSTTHATTSSPPTTTTATVTTRSARCPAPTVPILGTCLAVSMP